MESQSIFVTQSNDKFDTISKALSKEGITLAAVNSYGKDTFKECSSFFPRRNGYNPELVTEKVKLALQSYGFREVFQIIIAYGRIKAIVAASPAAVVKQALAHNLDIELKNGSSDDTLELQQFRGKPLKSVPVHKLLVIKNAENENVVPVYKGAVNTNYVKTTGGDKATVFSQTISDISLICTHLFHWKKNKFVLKDAWTDAEFIRLGLVNVMHSQRDTYISALCEILESGIKNSSRADDLKATDIFGPFLQEMLETAFTEKNNSVAYAALMDVFGSLFLNYPVRENGKDVYHKVLDVIRILDKQNNETTLLTFNFPKTFMARTVIQAIDKTAFNIRGGNATFEQAISEMKNARSKCGTNVNNETTPGTREMLGGVRTGTNYIDYVNLTADLSVIDFKKHKRICLVTKTSKHVKLFLKSIGNATAGMYITVLINKNYYDPSIIDETYQKKTIKGSSHIKVETYEDSADVARQRTVFFYFYAKDNDANGNKTTIAEAGKTWVETFKKKEYACIGRIANFPGLMGTRGLTVYNSAAMHNMVSWVGKDVSFLEDKLKERYSLATDESAYYHSVVVINFLRQINPFWQKEPIDILQRFGVRVPTLQLKINGMVMMSESRQEYGDLFSDSNDFTVYTSVAYRANVMAEAEKRSSAVLDNTDLFGSEEPKNDTGNNSNPNVPQSQGIADSFDGLFGDDDLTEGYSTK